MIPSFILDLAEKHWYFQGFNGTPALLYGPTFSMMRSMPDCLGYGYRSGSVGFFEKDVSYFLYAWNDLHEVFDALWKRYQQDHGYLQLLLTKDKERCATVRAYVDKFSTDTSWDTAFEETLFRLWREANTLYEYLVGVSHIVEGFTLTTEEKIRGLVEKIYGEKAGDALATLTTPTIPSFLTTERYDLACIAQMSQKTAQEAALKNHTEKYFWKLNSYTSAKTLTREYFTHEMHELIRKDLVDAIIRAYQSHPKRVADRDRAIQYIPDPELKDLIMVTTAIGEIHDRRKEHMTRMITVLDALLQEIAERFEIPITDLRYVQPHELERLEEMRATLHERRDKSVYVFTHEGSSVFMNDEAKDIIALFKKKEQGNTDQVIRGKCASPGIVSGIVKVCRGEAELVKVGEGDILVACMTQPEFIPAMKKASAVITDEGGLTCHAAIVSRELGIPCVIGAKIATQVLHDGDEVEVNANNGVVTIVRRV